MIIKSAEDKIGGLAEWIKVVRTLDLIDQPGSLNETILINGEIFCFFHVMRHKES